jgi:hypothetical protein
MTSPTLNPPAADAMMIGVRLDCREIDGGGSIGGGTTGDFADPLAGWFIRCSAVLAGRGAWLGRRWLNGRIDRLQNPSVFPIFVRRR